MASHVPAAEQDAPPQQSESVTQLPPDAAHWQMPAVHWLERQSVETMQVAPAAAPVAAAHCPFVHTTIGWLHCSSVAQAHAPLVHWAEQVPGIVERSHASSAGQSVALAQPIGAPAVERNARQ